MRELTRYRTALIRERTAEANRRQKTREGTNITRAAVASDVLGARRGSGWRRRRAKIPQVIQAVEGSFGLHQRFLVAQQLAHIDYRDDAIGQVSGEVAQRLAPFEATLERLDALPGVGRRTAEGVRAESGVEMGQFPSAAHLAAWAGLCPGNHESAGKRGTTKTRTGSRWLRALVVNAAHAVGRTKQTALGARYRALVARRGKKRGAVAVGHTLLLIAYHVLTRMTTAPASPWPAPISLSPTT